MAPSQVMDVIAKRQNLNNNNDDNYCDFYSCYSSWDNWGRWVALVVIIAAFVLIAITFSCINSRRRRRRGMAPMYGTGWMAKPYGGPNQQQQHYGQYGGPAPPYSYNAPMGNQQTGNTFNSNDGYYGNHHGGDFELQPPQNSYQPQRGGDPVYEAPLGPPPTKGDGIIR